MGQDFFNGQQIGHGFFEFLSSRGIFGMDLKNRERVVRFGKGQKGDSGPTLQRQSGNAERA